MKRSLFLWIATLCLGVSTAFAQDRTVSGTVVSGEDGAPLPGVTVLVKGTSAGGVTDINGAYKILVPEGGSTLVFTFIGFKNQEVAIGDQTKVDVTLEVDAQQLEEVVVTGFGVERKTASLGYAMQNVAGDNLDKAREVNVVNSLAGKVAGVQITGASQMGGSSRILIRGANSFTGNNQPLFVVDGVPIDNSNFTSTNQARGGGGYDYGNAAQDLNPDDIESMAVLKGAAATAIYGSRGANGVIEITTKKGSNRKGIGVSINSGISWQEVFVLPDYQNRYGAAAITDAEGNYVTDGSGNVILNYGLDGSWGLPLDGTNARHWDSWDEYDTENFGQGRPLTGSPNNVQDFFQTGMMLNNNVSLSGGDEKNTFRLSYTNVNQRGTQVNSELDRNTINFSGTSKLSDRLTSTVTANYVVTDVQGRPATGYGDRNVMQAFNQWYQRQLDTDRLKENYLAPDGTQRTWNRKSSTNSDPNYFNNPFWDRYVNYQEDRRERMFGNFTLQYQLLDWLSVRGRAMMDYYNDRRIERAEIGSVEEPFYQEGLRELKETNFDLTLNINKNLTPDLNLTGFVGTNFRTDTYYRNVASTRDGLNLPNYWNLANSAGTPNIDDFYSEKRVNSLFGSMSFGYKDMLYLDVTGRNDWSSALPEGNNSYFYPSVSSSFVFSELIDMPALSFAKARLGWAQTGNDTNPYRINPVYSQLDNFVSADGTTYPRVTLPDQLNNPSLRPEMTTEIEFGVAANFFQNRVGFDLTVYDRTTEDLIFTISPSSASGITTAVVNAGTMENKGVELMLNATPLKLSNGFQWDIGVNYAKNNNEVVSLGTIKSLQLGSLFGVSVEAREGQPYGAIVGPTIAKHTDGQRIVGTDGRYVTEPTNGVVGTTLADWTGSMTNTFSFKGVRISALIDMQQGGALYSLSHMFGRYSGVLAETAVGDMRENGVVQDGVVQTGTDDNGYPVSDGTANSTVISAPRWGADHYSRGRGELNTFDGTFVKLRELSIGYSLPKSMLGATPFNRVSVSFVGRNLAILSRNIPHVDPEAAVSAGNIQGIEGGQVPSERSFGFNINASF